MKDGKKTGIWWIMSALLAVCVIGWYIGELLGVRLIFAICAIAAVLATGYLLTKEYDVRKNESAERFADVLNSVERVAEQARQDTLTSTKRSEQLYARVMEELDAIQSQVVDAQDRLTSCVSDTAGASVERLNGQMDQVAKQISHVSEQIDKNATVMEQKLEKSGVDSTAKIDKLAQQAVEQTQSIIKTVDKNAIAMEQRLEKSERDNAAKIDKLTQQVVGQTQSIIKIVDKNEQTRQKDATDTNNALEAMCGSFENAVAAYQELENRMAALEQQNIHLQQLTTLIGTVRSDIAMINEIRGFVDEQKAGKKVRIVRDDENKVVVENLMNSDGVRIEKSKMYRDKKLVFEAEFNEVGKMVLSRSYDKKGNLDTEVSYAPDDHGKPTIRDVAKEVFSGIKKNTKRK